MQRKQKWKKIIIGVSVLILMGGFTFSERAIAHDLKSSDDQTYPQLLSTSTKSTPLSVKESTKIKMAVSPRAAAGQGEILYDVIYVGANIWRFDNVDVGSTPAGSGGYKTIDISYPAELQLNYIAPTG